MAYTKLIYHIVFRPKDNSPFSIVADDATLGDNQGHLSEIIMLGSGSKLGYSKNPRTLNCFRAHFVVPVTSGGEQSARSFVLNFGDGETAEIRTTNYTNSTNSEEWFTLDGRRLSAAPTAKGLYIINGKKTVIK